MPRTISIAKPLGYAKPVARADGGRRVVRDWLVVGSSSIACHAISGVTGILLRRLLDPTQIGIWQALKLLLSYGNYAGLGASKGAVRDWTVARGDGRIETARRSLNVAHSVNLATSAIYAVVLIATGFWTWTSRPSESAALWGAGLVAVGAMTLVQRAVTYRVTILRAQRQFGDTSRLALIEAGLTLSICVSAAWLFGLAGLLAGTFAVLCASFVWLRWQCPVRLRAEWNSTEAARLIGVGAPILAAGALSSLMRSLDRWMVLGYLSDGAYQLGCYSVALMVATQIYGLANLLSTVMGPRYGECFGRTGDRREVARLAARASEPQAAVLALLGGTAVTLGPALLDWLLPAYHSGLAAVVWLVPGVIALGMSLPASQYLVAVGRQNRVLVALGGATITAALGNHIALSGGWGLVGVARATSTAYGVYFVMLFCSSLWNELNVKARLRYAATTLLLIVPVMGLALSTSAVLGERSLQPRGALLSTAAVVCVWSLMATLAWRGGGWQNLWREELGQ